MVSKSRINVLSGLEGLLEIMGLKLGDDERRKLILN